MDTFARGIFSNINNNSPEEIRCFIDYLFYLSLEPLFSNYIHKDLYNEIVPNLISNIFNYIIKHLSYLQREEHISLINIQPHLIQELKILLIQYNKIKQIQSYINATDKNQKHLLYTMNDFYTDLPQEYQLGVLL